MTSAHSNMLTDDDKKNIVDSWRLVVPIAPTAADLFYRRLFELRPDYRQLFPEEMDKQKQKLIRMLQFIVKSMDWMSEQWRDEVAPEDDLCLVVLAMGRRHDQLYKIPEDSYGPVGEALIWTLQQGLGDAFTEELHASWGRLYGVVSTTMKMGARAGKVSMDLRLHGS